MIFQFTDQDLIKSAGWKSWKAGKDLSRVFENLKISESAVSGILKMGRKKIHTVVKLQKGDLTPTCTCPAYYQSHGFCEHSVALLLQAREVKSHSSGETEEKIDTVTTEGWRVGAIMPKGMKSLMSKGNFPLKVSVIKDDGGDKSHLPLIKALGLPLEEKEHLVQVPRSFIEDLLKLNAHSPFLNTPESSVIGSISACRFPVEARREGEDVFIHCPSLKSWDIHFLDNRLALLINEDAGAYNLQRSPLAPHLHKFKEEEMEYSVAHLFKNYDALSCWFDLQEVSALIQPILTPAKQRFKIHLEGTVKKVNASVEVHYNGKVFPLTNSPAQQVEILQYEADSFLIRNNAAEHHASSLLLDAGLEPQEKGLFLLEGEAEIQEFVAYTLPLMRKEHWEVSMMGSFRAFACNVTILSLFLKVDPHNEDDEYVSFTYTFQTEQGQGMKASDSQRLFQSGKQSFKLKNGKVALLSQKEFTLISEVLLDSSVRQVGEKYSMPKSQLPYLRNISINGFNSDFSQPVKSDSILREKLTFFNKLRSYQQEGVSWLIHTLKRQRAALLADDMGLGKTVQTLAVAETLAGGDKEEILIICPASLISNWKAERALWLPDSTLSFTITSYQKYLSEVKIHKEMDYTFCIIDEASVIKNPGTKIAKALQQQPAQYKLALTGTPLENSAQDLWSIFQFLKPTYLGNQKHFTERFVKPLQKPGYTAQLASRRLKAKLESYSLRRTKAQVLTDLPPKTHRIDYCEMNSVQKREGEKIRKAYEALKESEETSQNAIQILTTVLRYRQVANDPRLVDPEITELSPKTKRLLEILDQARLLNKKVLIFSQFAEMLKILHAQLEAQGHRCSILTGSSSDRDEQIQNFKDPHGNEVFLISLKAGGYGLNLTEANFVIHYDPWWNPAVENQATDRAYRIGQTEPVSVIKLITQNSIDERILELQRTKQNLYSLAIEDQNPTLTGLTTEDLKSLL